MTKVRKFRSSEVPNFIAYRYNKLINFNIYIKYPNIRTSEYPNFVCSKKRLRTMCRAYADMMRSLCGQGAQALGTGGEAPILSQP